MLANEKFKRTNPLLAWFKTNLGIFVVVIIMIAALSSLSPVFLTYNNMISVLRQVANNIYLAMGMTLVMIMGNIDLSIGSTVALSGIVTVSLIITDGMSVPCAVAIGILIGLFVGLINGTVIAFFKLPAFIATLSTMYVVRGLAYIYTGGKSIRITVDSYNAIGTGFVGKVPFPVIYMFIIIAVFAVLLRKTKFGTYVYAIGGNTESARLSGVPIKKTQILVFALQGLLAGFAGVVLAARMYSGQPTVGEGYEMDAIAACVLGGVSMSGGVGSIGGTVLGALIIGMISNGLNLLGMGSYWQLVAKGIIILIAVLIDILRNNQNIKKYMAIRTAKNK